MIFWLGTEPESPFPPLSLALSEPNGLLAAGGDLHPQRLLNAYRLGIFPWFSADQPILWWCPEPRCVLTVKDLHLSRRLQRELRQIPIQISSDQAFSRIMEACATAPGRGGAGSWIVPEMCLAYEQLHQLGYARSIEIWHGDTLVGGLYGVNIGRMFFAESMCTLSHSASKVALLALCWAMHQAGATLIDCQISNPHLMRMGAREISRPDFIHQVERHCDQRPACEWPEHWPALKDLLNWYQCTGTSMGAAG